LIISKNGYCPLIQPMIPRLAFFLTDPSAGGSPVY
jgi:hypothetical protein